MCIVLLTTAHPGYALVVIDNRDEFILRPTSRPHWWTHPTTGEAVLSSRDLERAEQGTWLGISRTGLLAVLTNFRDPVGPDADPASATPIAGIRSRGTMVNAWLGGRLSGQGGVREGVRRLVEDAGVGGVGGFSMLCGRLRKHGDEGLAVVSNRAGGVDDVPVIGRGRGGVWGLSNTRYDDEWPKVALGKQLLATAVQDAADRDASESELVAALFDILDKDTLPKRSADVNLAEFVTEPRFSIFIPAIGDKAQRAAMQEAAAATPVTEDRGSAAGQSGSGFETGLYGTQRQTVLLVGWDGAVTFVERALYDAQGNAIPRGEGDVTFRFDIDGWDDGVPAQA